MTCSNFLCSCEAGPGLLLAAFGSLPNSSATETSRAAAALISYAIYAALTHEITNLPIDGTIFFSTKDERKSNPDKVAAAEAALNELKGVLSKLKSTPNKTPEIKKQIETVKKAIKKANDAMKKSEPHGITGKGN